MSDTDHLENVIAAGFTSVAATLAVTFPAGDGAAGLAQVFMAVIPAVALAVNRGKRRAEKREEIPVTDGGESR